eukprot:TRINITY_DN2712_c0_g1_i33.p1 TRINITY_DN2712_c0_g1~~TRINITY_DN2712_c0_g1_i33.p1  ORF type:complete len:129 (+),score=0.45 TRINITY_DN2712_c0_g1_i33:80-466(+)
MCIRDRPYIVFETISNLKHDYKSLYLIWASEKSHTITIGRKKDSNLRILHRSVSREHGEIEYFASCFHIRDFRSKYGTAVQVREPLLVPQGPSSKLNLVCSNVLLRFSLEDIGKKKERGTPVKTTQKD